MSEIKSFETYWEEGKGRRIALEVGYYIYPATPLGLTKYGMPCKVRKQAKVEIVNIRTGNRQDPSIAILDWDREYAVKVLTRQIRDKEAGK